jgi:AAA-like domain
MQSQSTFQVRRRGVILTIQGSRKLNQAKAEAEMVLCLGRYTLESLSEATGLTPTTLSKVFTCSAGVDKRTLKCCFDAFNLNFSMEDYQYLNSNEDNLTEMSLLQSAENFSNLEAVCDYSFQMFGDCTNSPQSNKMAKSPSHPTVPGGQMPLDSVFYVDRPILESLCYEAISQPGIVVNIRAPKQMGKSSLMSRILAYSKSLGYKTVSLNLQLADKEILQNLEHFLKWFCARVSKQLGLPNQTANFWDNSLGSKSNANDYFNDVILANIEHPLVIGIDEVTQLFSYPHIAGEFLELLRVWSERAKSVADMNLSSKLRLVTIHSTEILMPSAINPSLLNTGLVIELPDFTTTQVQDLANRWGLEITQPQIQQLITILGGHPYRLQLAFYCLQQQTITLNELLENSETAVAIYAEHLEQQWWNLRQYPELCPVFTQIITQSTPVDCTPEQGFQLQRMGLVYLKGDQASLSCELFREYFLSILPI